MKLSRFGFKKWLLGCAVIVIILLGTVSVVWHWPLGGIFYTNYQGNVYEQKKAPGNCDNIFGCETVISYWQIPGAHLWNFTRIGSAFGKTNDQVYCGTSLLKDADPSSFEFVSGNYAKDKNHLYMGSDNEFYHICLRLFKTDPATGASVNFNTSHVKLFSECNLIIDGDGVYISNQSIMNADAGAAVEDHLPATGYYDIPMELIKIKDADPKTFTITNLDTGNDTSCIAKDKNSSYIISGKKDGNAGGISGWEISTTDANNNISKTYYPN